METASSTASSPTQHTAAHAMPASGASSTVDATMRHDRDEPPQWRGRLPRRHRRTVPDWVPADLRPEVLRQQVRTAADAFALLDRLDDLAPALRREMASAVAALARATGRPPDSISLRPVEIRPLLRAMAHGPMGISRKRLSNVRSALKALAKRVGHHIGDDVRYAPLEGCWASLIDPLPAHPWTALLTAFARFCARSGLAPDDVTEETLRAYRGWLEAETYDLTPNVLAVLRAAWNRHAGRHPNWPSRRIAPLGDPRQVALGSTDLPASLLAEIEAFAQTRSAPFALDGPAVRPLKPATAEDRGRRLRYAASVLIRLGEPKEAVASLEKLVTVENAKRIVLWMRQRSGMNEWTSNERQVALAFADVARCVLGAPPQLVADLEAVLRRTSTPQRGLSKRARDRLRPFDNPSLRVRLFNLPAEGYRQAEAELAAGRTVRAAQLHERALALDLLLLQPLRPRALAALDVVMHFERDPNGRVERLHVPGQLVKNGVAIDAPIPRTLARRLDRHRKVFRPLLPNPTGGTALFPGDRKSARSREALNEGMSSWVQRELGVPFSIGLVRHIVATVLYDADPNAGPVAQRLLAHTTIQTTEKMYGHMSTRAAHRIWSEQIESARSRPGQRSAGR
jgi:integrase